MSFSKYEMEAETAQQLEVVQQQQIQALLANVEELTHQNEELRKTMESQNVVCQWTGENQNEEESNSQANRRDRTSREDSSRMENELHNMRKEMDELKRTKAERIWMGWFEGQTHYWSTEPTPPTEILSPTVGVVWRFQGSFESHWIVQDTNAITDDPRQGDVQGIPNNTKRSN